MFVGEQTACDISTWTYLHEHMMRKSRSATCMHVSGYGQRALAQAFCITLFWSLLVLFYVTNIIKRTSCPRFLRVQLTTMSSIKRTWRRSRSEIGYNATDHGSPEQRTTGPHSAGHSSKCQWWWFTNQISYCIITGVWGTNRLPDTIVSVRRTSSSCIDRQTVHESIPLSHELLNES